ncbi:uncharacterized protein LOC112340879 [Selaginella moellendorffii]|uniref:uncharacterized protein LOC112340879 n=1 Tax=Selaginella moellendorffii TaxID=88036 RepID=UPI000D1C7A60|nr:uncharacterized protein LOC112340879 [Selaginella moellendorffii]|eukprot:XP_024515807.1 uncharacterized protein LOC112340879 [Selaginella moellendorffii]
MKRCVPEVRLCSCFSYECFNSHKSPQAKNSHCHAKNCRVLNNSGSPSSEDSYVELVSWDGELAVTERKKAVAQSRTRPLSSHIRKALARAARELPEATVPYEFSQRACHTPAGVSGILELLSFTV